MKQDHTIWKLGMAAAVAWGSSCVVLLGFGWIAIFPLRPEHPEVAPWRLWNDLLDSAVWITSLFTVLECVALACAVPLLRRMKTGFVMLVAGGAPSLMMILSMLFPSVIHFGTPIGAAVFFMLFTILTFAGIYGLLLIQRALRYEG